MITTEDRARAAMQAIGDTVRDAPPLQLPSAPGLPAAAGRGRGCRHRAGDNQRCPERSRGFALSFDDFRRPGRQAREHPRRARVLRRLDAGEHAVPCRRRHRHRQAGG
jgi:hypothetical protein